MSEIDSWPAAVTACVTAICFAVPTSIFIYHYFKNWED